MSRYNGGFSISAPAGNHILTPSRDIAESGISALDASMAIQHDADVLNLTRSAAVAADVDRSGTITALDASMILRQVVGLSTLPFQNAEQVWLFTPESRSYTSLAANQTGQDFTAILLGDPSGNWSATAATMAPRAGSTANLELSVEEITAGEEFSVSVALVDTSTPFRSLEIVLSFDHTIFSALGVQNVGLPDWNVAYNVDVDGEVRIAAAGSSPLSSIAELLSIQFLATGHNGDESDLKVQKLEVDEGQVASSMDGITLRIGASERIFHDGFTSKP